MNTDLQRAHADAYRHGVLIVSEQIYWPNKSSSYKKQTTPTPLSSTHANIALQNTLQKPHPVISKLPPVSQSFYSIQQRVDEKGLQKPQKNSTYKIFYGYQRQPYVPLITNNTKQQDLTAKVETDLFKQTEDQLKNTYGYADPRVQEMAKTLRSGIGIPMPQTIKPPLPQGAPADYEDPNFSLTGNIGKVEDSSAKDVKVLEIDQKTLNRNTLSGISAKSYNPFSTQRILGDKLKALSQADYDKLIKGDCIEAQILLGHHPQISQFGKREFATTYDLSFNQRIKPQTQVYSKFTPDLTQTAREFHKNPVYEQTFQEKIPQVYNKEQLKNERIERPYQPHTGYYDRTHMKNEYLRTRD